MLTAWQMLWVHRTNRLCSITIRLPRLERLALLLHVIEAKCRTAGGGTLSGDRPDDILIRHSETTEVSSSTLTRHIEG